MDWNDDDLRSLALALKAESRAAGFDLCGITTSTPFTREGQVLAAWVTHGYHGEMDYMARNAPRSPDPQKVVSEARALVVVGLYYGNSAHEEDAEAGLPERALADARGRISKYARGDDYHKVMEPGLRRLAGFLLERGARVARYYVDTGPVIDRAAARRAGIGWYGKNTMIITRRGYGSWVFLGEILTDIPFPPDNPDDGDCGRCTLCLDACPTGAIIAPYTVDARRCISYLTIEHRGAIPREMRPLIGEHIFGCDICQVVCPHNTESPDRSHPEFAPRDGVGARPALIPLLNIDEEEFRQRFHGSAIMRAKRRGLRRNVAVALGNTRDPASVPALLAALADKTDPLVRGHAAWALGRIGTREAREGLRGSLAGEPDPDVREEITHALAEGGA
jgi:epoxyqueuosine reductase